MMVIATVKDADRELIPVSPEPPNFQYTPVGGTLLRIRKSRDHGRGRKPTCASACRPWWTRRSGKAVACILRTGAGREGGEICVVVWPGDEPAKRRPTASWRRTPLYSADRAARYGHAICVCARVYGSDPFLHMVATISTCPTPPMPALKRLVELAEAEACSVSWVQPTRETCCRSRSRRRPARSRPQGLVPSDYRIREAHPHRSRAATDGPRPASRLLSLFFRYEC